MLEGLGGRLGSKLGGLGIYIYIFIYSYIYIYIYTDIYKYRVRESLAVFLVIVRGIKHCLTSYWDLQAFARGAGETSKADTMVLAADVDKAVNSKVFWGYLSVLKCMSTILVAAEEFCESCPCHFKHLMEARDKADPEIYQLLKHRWKDCPFKGMMSAEISGSDFINRITSVCDMTTAELLQYLPGDLRAEDRATCIRECEAGRASICFIYVSKLAHFRFSHFALFRIGHLDNDEAMHALRYCLDNHESHHPRIQRLRELRVLAEALLNGADLFEERMKPLLEFIGELRFAPSTDRWQEGQHAKIHKAFRSSSHASEHTVSFNLRQKEMVTMLKQDPHNISVFASFVSEVHNP